MSEFDFSQDIYELLQVEPFANEKDISKAYRLKALQYHPDKNPDNPDAEKMFLLVKKSFDVLNNPETRKKYDEMYKAKLERKKRDAEMDAVRKRMMDKLVNGESAFKKRKDEEYEEKVKRQMQLNELKRQGYEKIKEEEDILLRKYFDSKENVELEKQKESELDRTLHIKWLNIDSYDKEMLLHLFNDYGMVEHLVMSTTKPSAVILFKTTTEAFYSEGDERLEPFTINWAKGSAPMIAKKVDEEKTEKKNLNLEKNFLDNFDEFENTILMKLRKAQQMKNQR
ncbi:DnaJ domain-containing protein [Rozella allomycis CSF55]|uniref:DnaJ domain-containing protein n=1 Tax=Rozella allomycis (strain CSF55) TaxID=988480 RepID=A0A075ARV6_ROZAC|nr:DnaJ domain-containing protein [Rozella allomycis CSF55]|eukprot:EPZ31268.1 DnaJ domain-containing protein [Rozella allomycis CSF55]